MAKEYMQDITPPSGSSGRSLKVKAHEKPTPPPSEPEEEREEAFEGDAAEMEQSQTPGKSIRNIHMTPSRFRPRIDAGTREENDPPPVPGRKGKWLWGGVALAALFLVAVALVALRPTSVTVLPRSHSVLFDDTAVFTAYPAGGASGTLGFTLERMTFEDSEVVPAKGSEEVQEKASGTVTVFNSYSADPVKLLKNTRFQTPDGLLFRTPAEVMVPGKRGATPGQIDVTVIADKAGATYNTGPVQRFTLPGLASSPAMYAGVYARSSVAMTGGFAGARPAASPSDIETARAKIRDRLQQKALEGIRAKGSESTVAFADLAYIAFESLLPTSEGSGSARISERVTVALPVFAANNFAVVVGRSVAADAEDQGMRLKDTSTLTAHRSATSMVSDTTSFQFTLDGKTTLIWSVNPTELAQALAGKDETAFQAIVAGFPGIEEAHARIEPFWKKTFPENPADIKVNLEEPKPAA